MGVIAGGGDAAGRIEVDAGRAAGSGAAGRAAEGDDPGAVAAASAVAADRLRLDSVGVEPGRADRPGVFGIGRAAVAADVARTGIADDAIAAAAVAGIAAEALDEDSDRAGVGGRDVADIIDAGVAARRGAAAAAARAAKVASPARSAASRPSTWRKCRGCRCRW